MSTKIRTIQDDEMTVIFVDTNIFLHYTPIKDIDWVKLIDTSCCKLLIAPIVIDELDKYKEDNSNKGKRARNSLKLFESFISSGADTIRDSVHLKLIHNKPIEKTYSENGLNFNEQDHRLFASMIEYRIENPNDSILICTNDIGPRLRAKQFGFKSLVLKEEYKLKSIESPEEKKIRQLEKELSQVKSQLPKLAITFGENKSYYNFHVLSEFENKDDFLSREYDLIKNKYPYLKNEYPDLNSNLYHSFLYETMNKHSDEIIKAYNNDLDEYLENYKEYLSYVFRIKEEESRTVDLKLFLINSGNAPALDIFLKLNLPVKAKVFDKNN